ncbi:MAG TPA: transcriptional regulator [Desulfobacterales bacterium]
MKTIRQEIVDMLATQALTARELGRALRMNPREVTDHLEHIRKSLAAGGKRLNIQPSRCRKCGYEFADRRKLAPPSRCPRCKSTYLDPPYYEVEDTP